MLYVEYVEAMSMVGMAPGGGSYLPPSAAFFLREGAGMSGWTMLARHAPDTHVSLSA
jgi:hypothetical protein